MRLRHKIALVAVAVFLTAIVYVGGRDASGDWVILENCRLIVNPANDGDSFHASVGEKEYIFRLYMVDAPETDAMSPARLVEQATHFHITVPQAIEVGEAAKAFTRDKLAEPFTVFTRMSDAMGRSKIERFYAFVQTKEGDLGAQLVRNGLARIHGAKVIPPGSRRSREELQSLQQFEDQANQEKIGGWGINVGRLNVRAEKPSAFSFFVSGEKAARRATPVTAQAISAMRTPDSPTPRASSAPETKPAPTSGNPKLGKIDINTATEKELQSVPGIGPATAARIIAARPFRSADDLKRVSGIGDKRYEQIRPYFQ